MPLKKLYHQLSLPQKYILYLILGSFTWLSVIQYSKLSQRMRPSVLSLNVRLKGTQRKSQKKKKTFQADKYIDEAFVQYMKSFEGDMERYKNVYFIHKYLGQFIKDNTDLIDSMRKHAPIMNTDTYSNLYLFQGPEGAKEKSYCNLLTQKVGIQTDIGRYHTFLILLGANNDKKRVRHYQNIIKLFRKNKDKLYAYKTLYQELINNGCEETMVNYYVRGPYPNRSFTLIDHTINANTLVPEVVTVLIKKFGFNMKKQIEENKIGAWTLKFLHLHLLDFENIFRLDRLWIDLMKPAMTWYNLLIFFPNLIGNTYPRSEQGYSLPTFGNGLIARMINVGWSAICVIFGIPRNQAGTIIEDGNIITTILNAIYFTLTAFIFFFRYMVKEPFDIFDSRIYQAYKSTFGEMSRYAIYEEAVNEGIRVLRQVRTLFKLMKKLEILMEKDKELAAECKIYLAPIKKLLHSKKYKKLQYIVKETKKIGEKRVTKWELASSLFSGTRISDILRLVKKLHSLDEEVEAALLSAFTSFCLLETFVSMANFSYHNEAKKSKFRFVECNILEEEAPDQLARPKVDYENIYTLFIPIERVVKNNFKNVVDPKTGKEMIPIMYGYNGAGKSILIRTVIETEVLSQSFGYAFGDKVSSSFVDKIYLYTNIKDNPVKNLSLMMAETKKINEIIKEVDMLEDHERAMIFADEPAKGTNYQEGACYVASAFTYIQNRQNTMTVLSTHLDVLKIAEKDHYYGFAPFTPGFDENKGFTYKMEPGLGKHPVSIHVLEKMQTNPVVMENTVALLARDKDYMYRDKLVTKELKPLREKLFGGDNPIEYLLLCLLILLIGMLLGASIPILRRPSIAKEKVSS